jgi:hypothetical protein
MASPEDARHIIPVLRTLKEAGAEAYGLKFRADWASLPRAEAQRLLGRFTHVLVIATRSSVLQSWFFLAVGLGIGLGKRSSMAFYRPDPDWFPPRYLDQFPLLDDLGELGLFYRELGETWKVDAIRQASRAALLEMGVSYHAESLAECVREGNLHAVDLFLRAGMPPDFRDKHGVPLLCLASRHRHRGVATLLLDAGALLDLQSEDRGYTPLMDAVHAGAPDLVELFLERGADLDRESKDGQTALVIAVGRSDVALAARLLEKGADADKADKLGLSARKYAKLFKKAEMIAVFDALAGDPPAGGAGPAA